MCTLAFYFHAFPHHPIVAGANRDEFLSRPSAAPLQLWPSPWVCGGQDLLAGGTWLGINANSMLVGILNRHTSAPPDLRRRSRGLLCLDVLKHDSVLKAVNSVTSQPAQHYNPFNLLIADPTTAYVIYAQEQTIETQRLTPGVHLLTNYNLNDPQCPRTARSFQNFSQIVSYDKSQSSPSTSQIFAQLRPLLASHAPDPDPRASVCLHLDGYGTCSSTMLAYSGHEHRYAYSFASGSPCRSAYHEVFIPEGGRASHPPSTM